MASLKDIADSLDVSISLVSKVLNNRLGTTSVRPELVDKIQETAVKMGFRKNLSAAALRRGRHDVIGVFVHRFGMAGSGIVEDMVDGIASEAMKSHQKQLLNFFNTTEEFLELAESAHGALMDGLIVAGIIHEDITDRLLAIRTSGVPVITVHDRQVHEALPNVGISQVRVEQIATEHLIERGCRTIVHIHNRDDRLEGFKTALTNAGVECKPDRIYHAPYEDYSHNAGSAAVAEFLRRGVDFDGIVAQADQEAVGAINKLFETGRVVPDDVRVIGIDDAPYCQFARVPLSSVSQNCRLRGQTAVDLLMRAIDQEPIESIDLDPILRPRESTR